MYPGNKGRRDIGNIRHELGRGELSPNGATSDDEDFVDVDDASSSLLSMIVVTPPFLSLLSLPQKK